MPLLPTLLKPDALDVLAGVGALTHLQWLRANAATASAAIAQSFPIAVQTAAKASPIQVDKQQSTSRFLSENYS
jgi:hypothetical protein